MLGPMTVRSEPDVELSAAVDALRSRQPTVGLAVGVVRGGGLARFEGRGVADILSRTPVTEDTVFRIASITKTCTAVAVLQLWEQGLVDLDAPANDHLRSYALVPTRAAFRPATVRHLLTHTAGLAEVARPWGAVLPDFGESVRAGRRMPPLGNFYGGRLRVHAEPGTRFVYTNHGPATLGQLVEDVTGMPLARYLRTRVFEPLGMVDSDLVRSERIADRVATGYEIRSRGLRAVAARDMVTAGAASVYSTPRDMARYVAALLGGGRNEHGTVLRPATVAMMFAPHHQPHPRIPGMGLGFFRWDLDGHTAVGHQGTHPGFHSQVLLAPDAGVGAIAFTNGAHQPDLWLPGAVSALLRRLLGADDDRVRRDVPQRPEHWGGRCGWYRLPARLTDVRLRAMMGAGIEVFVRGGQLMLRFLTPVPALATGFPLHPDDEGDPAVFRIDLSDSGLGTIMIVFDEDAAGITSRVHLDVMPLTLDKQAPAANPRRWTLGATAAGAGAAVATAAARRRIGRRP